MNYSVLSESWHRTAGHYMLFTKNVSVLVTESRACDWERNVMKREKVSFKKRLFIKLGCYFSECETNRTKGETLLNISISETLYSGRTRLLASPRND